MWEHLVITEVVRIEILTLHQPLLQLQLIYLIEEEVEMEAVEAEIVEEDLQVLQVQVDQMKWGRFND
jgi:hypothetical protein